MIDQKTVVFREINDLKDAWKKFKSERSYNEMLSDNHKNFLTVLEREDLIDRLFTLTKILQENLKVEA